MAESLIELLLRDGLVSETGVSTVLADAGRSGKQPHHVLLDLGLVPERRFAEWMAGISRTALVEVIPESEAAELRHYIPAAVARSLQVVPLRLVDQQLFVVMVDARDGRTIDVLQGVTGQTVRALTGVRSDIERVIERLYGHDDADGSDLGNETVLHRPPALEFLRQPEDDEFGTVLRRPDAGEFGTVLSIPRPNVEDPGTQPPIPSAAEPQPGGDDATAPTSPLIEIGRRLDQIVRMIHRVEKRLDDLEALQRERDETLRR